MKHRCLPSLGFPFLIFREHVYPETSHTVLLPKMYSHFGMDHLAMEEKDSDIALEYSESEMYQHFRYALLTCVINFFAILNDTSAPYGLAAKSGLHIVLY